MNRHGDGPMSLRDVRRTKVAMSPTVHFLVSITVFVIVCGGRLSAEKFAPGYVPKTRIWYSYGLRLTEPQDASVSLTAMRGKETDTLLVSGWFAQIEPGLKGGKASIGWGGMSVYDPRWLPTLFAAGAKLSMMRTWGVSSRLVAGETLVGPELDLTFAAVKMTGGYLWRVNDIGRPGGVVTWGVGVGF